MSQTETAAGTASGQYTQGIHIVATIKRFSMEYSGHYSQFPMPSSAQYVGFSRQYIVISIHRFLLAYFARQREVSHPCTIVVSIDNLLCVAYN